MANPRLPGISENEQALLYAKLNEYNRGRASFKEVGVYLVVLPRPGKPNYSLWLYSPLLEKQSILYIHDLSPDINESLRMASTMFYYSKRCIILVDYNEKRMQSNGDDLIFFGKYRGHFLHEILKIDPAYLSWVAYKFIPKIPKQERFVKIAQAYHSIHLDIMIRKSEGEAFIQPLSGRIRRKADRLKIKSHPGKIGRRSVQNKSERHYPTVFCQAGTDFDRCQWKFSHHEYSIKKSQCGFMHSIRDRT